MPFAPLVTFPTCQDYCNAKPKKKAAKPAAKPKAAAKGGSTQDAVKALKGVVDQQGIETTTADHPTTSSIVPIVHFGRTSRKRQAFIVGPPKAIFTVPAWRSWANTLGLRRVPYLDVSFLPGDEKW